jgi:Ca-activated chloride channel family protein
MKTIFWATLCMAAVVVGLADEARAADQLTLNVSPVRNILKAAEKGNTWIRVELVGFKQKSSKQRAPVNLAIVLDRSGSMNGEKIQRAKEAAVDAVRQLGPNDIVSIVTYDDVVNVLVPATKLTDVEQVVEKIRKIKVGGRTALFAGVSKGVAEVRKFLDKEHVNRVILLSDGLANIGPSSAGELASFGESLVKENISVSTFGLGLGYNEDLMSGLASNSGGNHLFVENAEVLADVFRREFDDVLSVVAQEVDIQVTIPEGIRPVRVLGNNSDIAGQQIVTRLAQVYSEQQRYILIEVEVPASEVGTDRELATVSVAYANMATHREDKLSGSTKVTFSDNDSEVSDSLNKDVLADVVTLVSSEQTKLATKYLDEGDLEKCKSTLQSNVDTLRYWAKECPDESKFLYGLAGDNKKRLSEVNAAKDKYDPSAIRARKNLRSYQLENDSQQRLTR